MEKYTAEVLRTIIGCATANESKGPLCLVIGGGVSNFTDVRVTFQGIANAFETVGDDALSTIKDSLKVVIRRGGPNSDEGVAILCSTLNRMGVSVGTTGGAQIPLLEPIKYVQSVFEKETSNTHGSNGNDNNYDAETIEKAQIGMNATKRSADVVITEALQHNWNICDVCDRGSRNVLILGMKRKEAQRMLDFDFAAGREQSIYGFVDVGRADSSQTGISTNRIGMEILGWGGKSICVPIYSSIETAFMDDEHPSPTIIVNLLSHRSAGKCAMEFMSKRQSPDTPEPLSTRMRSCSTMIIFAEGISEKESKQIRSMSFLKPSMRIIGPSSVGMVASGSRRILNAGGSMDSVIQTQLHHPGGCVGVVTRSGGLLNELCNSIARDTDTTVKQAVAIGGDRCPATSFIDVLLTMQQDASIKVLVMLGEVGGLHEYDVAHAIQRGDITKPLVSMCLGVSGEGLGSDMQFGHAGARALSEFESSTVKNAALKSAGAFVPADFDDIAKTVSVVLSSGKLSKDKLSQEEVCEEQRKVSIWQQEQCKSTPNFVSRITTENNGTTCYNNVPVSEVSGDIGRTLGLLWLRRDLPPAQTKILSAFVTLMADHGPCVSGAHNTIVASRAGKDPVSALASGLLTIGPRFGGALTDAGVGWYAAVQKGCTPFDFVNKYNKGQRIMGIGHRVYSKFNPDARVSHIEKLAREGLCSTPHLDFVRSVEEETLKKRSNLILNVDGVVSAIMLDLLAQVTPSVDTQELLNAGIFNGLFILSRTIGLLGHHFDQTTMKQGLYRHPEEDVLFTV